MREKILQLSFVLASITSIAQVGIGTDTPSESSILELKSNNKGFLPPRLSSSERDAIDVSNLPEGLVIYNLDNHCLENWNGSKWLNFCESSGSGSGNTANVDPLPANITLEGDQKKIFYSIYDNDYEPFDGINGLANTSVRNMDGTLDELIDLQGTLDYTGVQVKIPYSISGGGTVDLPAFQQTQTVITDHIEGGAATMDIEFLYDAHTALSGDGFITATIRTTASTDVLNFKKLDLNEGIGTDYGLLVANFTIATDDSGSTGAVQVKDIAAIPDRRFGETTTQQVGSTSETAGTSTPGEYHNFLYLPVTGEDGNTWLNHNLGAEYTDVNSNDFAINQAPTSYADRKASGSFFQWGRYSDGHELAKDGWQYPGLHSMLVNQAVDCSCNLPANSSTQPNSNLKYERVTTPTDWLDSNDIEGRWQGGKDALNNPCPDGFRLPTIIEFENYLTSAGMNTSNKGLDNTSHNLNLIGSGVMNPSSVDLSNPVMTNGHAYYWTSDHTVINSDNRPIYSLITKTQFYQNRIATMATGMNVRCIMD